MSTSDPHFSRLGEGSWEPGFLEGVAYRRRGTIPGETMVRLVRRTPYNGLAIHKQVLNRLENFLLYSTFQRLTNQSI